MFYGAILIKEFTIGVDFMVDNQILKGLLRSKAQMKSAGIEVNEALIDAFQRKITGESTTDDFIRRMREIGKGK